MNFGELRNYAFDFLKTSAAQGPWSDVEMGRYLQDAHMKVFGMVADTFEQFFESIFNLSETGGTDTIDLPLDCYRILSIERIAGGQSTPQNPWPLEKIDRRPTDIQNARGTWPMTTGTSPYPCSYYAIGQRQIRLVPIPSSTLSGSLRLSYIYRPTPLVSDTDVPFQQTAGIGGSGKDNLVEFHDILPLYVIEKCLLTPGEENPGLAQSVQAMRLERESELKTYLSRINLQANKTMEVTDAVTEYD